MTDQQRTTRIDFVKKLLVANGFEEHGGLNLSQIVFLKHRVGKVFKVEIEYERLFFEYHFEDNDARGFGVLYYWLPLNPLREFIKLSNKK